MKVAVISDIHGFSIALDRVLADIAAEPGVDHIIAAGDLAEGGPDPAGALARLREAGIPSVQGNTDRDLAAGSRSSAPASWVTQQLDTATIGWLADLPFQMRVPAPDGQSPVDDLLVVHANPFDQDRPISPDASDREVRELIGDTRAAVIAFGHIHIAYRRTIDGIQLLDVSAVGNPKDEDLRSKWGLVTWDPDTAQWTTELRYVPYPLVETLDQMERSGMPNWQKAATKLQRASYQERR